MRSFWISDSRFSLSLGLRVASELSCAGTGLIRARSCTNVGTCVSDRGISISVQRSASMSHPFAVSSYFFSNRVQRALAPERVRLTTPDQSKDQILRQARYQTVCAAAASDESDGSVDQLIRHTMLPLFAGDRWISDSATKSIIFTREPRFEPLFASCVW